MGIRRKKLQGAVQRVIKPRYSDEPEKAEIEIKEADDLYREIRVENTPTDEKGEVRPLKPGDEVDIVIEAESDPNLKRQK